MPLPEGVAIDEHGRPTTDAGAARRGAILPFGGHKGYALALAMHALGVLVRRWRADRAGYGYLFIAIKPDLLVPLDDYRRALPRRSPRSRRRRGRRASTRSVFPASARIASARDSRARASRSTGASTTR